MVELSVVVPVYGCRDCLPQLHQRLTAALSSVGSDYEIVFVDDRSPDGAWPVLEELANDDSHVRSVRLSRNFGQHAAITAGLAASQGVWTVVMDCDLQDPPEALPSLYARAREGFDLVLARRKRRAHSPVRVALSRFYFKFMNTVMGTNLDGEFGTFSILNRKVVDAYLSLGETDRHYLFVLHWLGFEQGTIDIELGERAAGRSSYTLGRLLRHAVSGVFFQTTNPLLYIVYLGFLVAACGIALAVYLVILAMVATPPPGWTSVMVIELVIGGFIITSLGVTGLYIGRVFQQVKGRPLYVVDEVARKSGERTATKKPAQRQEVESRT
ncbi:MAG TPA: glycosyltransferase family 2 protein [Candidatus Dormibacteraeota bacterium]|nr:glycosyltransferase family 2 protein [Candidatus Dormibacteraeota bacterium]